MWSLCSFVPQALNMTERLSLKKFYVSLEYSFRLLNDENIATSCGTIFKGRTPPSTLVPRHSVICHLTE
jgi:hypothetical protein